MKLMMTMALGLGACGLAALVPFDRIPSPAVERDAETAPVVEPTAAEAVAVPVPTPVPEASTPAGRRAMRNLDLIQKRFEILKEGARK